MKVVLCIVSFLLTHLSIVYSQDQSSREAFLNAYQGNWYLPADNSWDYGFFEHVVIYKGERWNYGPVVADQKNYQLELQSDAGRTLTLSVKKDDDSTLLVSNSLTKQQDAYRRVNTFLPPYQGEDRKAFYDSQYGHMDTAYVRGYLRNNTSSNPYKISVYDRITGEYDYFGDIDSLGFFEVKIPLLNTHQVYMDWGRSTILDVLEPGESYFIFHDLKSKETVVYGDNARLHNELVAYGDYTKKNNIRPKNEQAWRAQADLEKSVSHDDFLDLKLAQLDTMRQIDEAFIRERASLSDRAQYYITKNTDFDIAFTLMQRRFDLYRASQERFSAYYMGHVDSIFYHNQVQPATLVREHFTFLTDYVGYQSGTGGTVVYNSVVLNDLVKKGKIETTPILRQYIDVLARMDSTGYSSQDSTEKERLIALDTSLHNQLVDLFNQHEALIAQFVQKSLSLDSHDAVNRKYLSPALADAFYVKKVFELIGRNPVPLHPIFLEEISLHIQNPFLNQFIAHKNQALIALSGQNLRYQEHLRRTDHLKGSKDADELLADILAPHRGKVVYIDFWGTWCGPCVAEMAYVPELKSATQGMDVVYIYFANRTPEEAWTNFIKEKNIEGENVFHYNLDDEQQRAIEVRLGVNSFPTYMLVNPKGEFVNHAAPRPSQQTQLMAEMEKLLSP